MIIGLKLHNFNWNIVNSYKLGNWTRKKEKKKGRKKENNGL